MNKHLQIYTQVEKYNVLPWYELNLSYQNCIISVWLNDMIQFSAVSPEGGFFKLPLNSEILQSGEQKLKIRISATRNYRDNAPRTEMTDDTLLEVGVVEEDRKILSNPDRTVLKFIPPRIKKDGIEIFDFEGKETAVYEISFHARVPYTLEGWREGHDLRELPGVERKVRAFYEVFRTKFQNGDSSWLSNAIYRKEVEIARSLYYNTAMDSDQRWKDNQETFREEGKRYENDHLHLSDYELEFYGSGKVAGLVNKSKPFFGARGLVYTTPSFMEKNGEKIFFDQYNTFPLYLFLPRGSKEFEIIR